jgi:hypothetical protein
VNDPGNSRISVFTKEGKFLKSHRTPPFTYDTPVVNSRGDIYLFSPSGIKVLDRYDSSFRLRSSLLDIKEHFSFPYGKPPFPILQRADEGECLKLITKRDEIVIVSNYSFKVFIYDKNDKKIGEFEIKEKRIREDYKKWLEKLKKDQMWLDPFVAFLNQNNNLCLLYNREDNISEIYVYSLDGVYLGFWRFPQNLLICSYPGCVQDSGKIYALEGKSCLKVVIYKF